MSLWDIIVWPFARLLEILYNWTDSYGLAIILFALVVNLILLPFMAKSKKGMMKTTRIQPQLKELEKKHRGNQQKYQQEVMKLYKEQGASPTSGCLWSLIPFPILIALYSVIRQPLGSMMGLGDESIKKLTEWATQNAGFVASKQGTYDQIGVADAIHKNWDAVTSALGNFDGKLLNIDYSFLGMNLGSIPDWKIWNFDFSSADILATIGLFLIPVVSAGLQAASMWISQKMNNQVATNADGEQDTDAAKAANQTNATMMLMMPLMSLWIGFSMPAAISIYWIAQAVFGAVQDYFLTKHYRKVYDEEDAVKQEIAAKRRAEEAEKERQRALRREQNPDGITDNVSKKKIRQQEKEAAEKAARAYEAKKNPVQESEEKKPLSGDPERPYSRGRAYDPAHYGRKRSAGSDAEQTEE